LFEPFEPLDGDQGTVGAGAGVGGGAEVGVGARGGVTDPFGLGTAIVWGMGGSMGCGATTGGGADVARDGGAGDATGGGSLPPRPTMIAAPPPSATPTTIAGTSHQRFARAGTTGHGDRMTTPGRAASSRTRGVPSVGHRSPPANCLSQVGQYHSPGSVDSAAETGIWTSRRC
jgi:hypothetical protein